MFKYLVFNGKKTPLYYHKTDGGAEYLMDAHIGDEGVFEGATVLLRIDGNELEAMRFGTLETAIPHSFKVAAATKMLKLCKEFSDNEEAQIQIANNYMLHVLSTLGFDGLVSEYLRGLRLF